MLKKVLVGAAAVAALMTPSLAAADTSGYASFSINSLDDDNDGNKEDYLEFNGAVVGSLGGSWNVQFDASAQDMGHSNHTDNMSTTIVHAFWRGESFAFGGFGGVTTGEIDGPLLGAEAALYLDRFSLAGSAFFGGDRESGDDPITGYGAAGTFFLSDNFSLGADVNYYEFYENVAQDGTIYGVNAEYQFGGGPFSIYGGYHISDEDYFGTDKEVTSFTLGGRLNFGTSTLLERDRSGASMPGASQLSRAQVFGW